jgi:hypothetical protein
MIRHISKMPFDGMDGTWVQRVIADWMASCSRFFEISQDSLGRCALENGPVCYRAVAVSAENISILVEPRTQSDRWTVTLTALVRHGSISRLLVMHKLLVMHNG